MITVMFPSRGRLQSVRRLSALLREYAAGEVQILAGIDPDEIYPAIPGVEFWRSDRRHGYNGQQHYLNAMLPMVAGDWILSWGDDALMATKGWDAIIARHGPAVLWPTSNGFPYCFPVFPASWARALGRVTPTPHVDSYWLSVGKGLNRHVEIPVHVWHDRKDLTGGHDDQTYAEGRAMLGQTGMADDGGAEVIAKDVETIRRLL